VTCWFFFDVNAVYPVSATSASETQQSSCSSQIARGYLMPFQAPPGMAAIAARMLEFMGTVTRTGRRRERIALITAAE